jgi:hypothetical protein
VRFFFAVASSSVIGPRFTLGVGVIGGGGSKDEEAAGSGPGDKDCASASQDNHVKLFNSPPPTAC